MLPKMTAMTGSRDFERAEMNSWFPDVLANWYDTLSRSCAEISVDQWRYVRPRLVDEWARALALAPNTAACWISERIVTAATENERMERTFRALQASSSAIETVGISPILEYGGSEWTSIREHWFQQGNLLRAVPGLLLPRRGRRFGWQGTRPAAKIYSPASMFRGFLRAELPSALAIRIRVMSDLDVPIEALSRRLRVAVAPLVGDLDEIRFEPLDDGGRRAFRVSLVDPSRLTIRAMRALRRAGRFGCDILMIPELCLSPKGQELLSERARKIVCRSGGRPWLFLAGSSHTPRPSGGFRNRALLLNAAGNVLLTHNKMYPYEISTQEQDRYGIAEALRSEPRVEDISVLPRKLEILECPLGRTAILICEDLSNITAIGPIVQELEIDWLLVPVMDGVQTRSRWTARYSEMFAAQYGTNVLVGTCGALTSAHRNEMLKKGVDLGRGCALFTQLRQSRTKVESISPGVMHPSLAVFDIGSWDSDIATS